MSMHTTTIMIGLFSAVTSSCAFLSAEAFELISEIKWWQIKLNQHDSFSALELCTALCFLRHFHYFLISKLTVAALSLLNQWIPLSSTTQGEVLWSTIPWGSSNSCPFHWLIFIKNKIRFGLPKWKNWMNTEQSRPLQTWCRTAPIELCSNTAPGFWTSVLADLAWCDSAGPERWATHTDPDRLGRAYGSAGCAEGDTAPGE